MSDSVVRKRSPMIKAKSDISFKEYSQKICQTTNINSTYGFYYDIEANKWIRPCAICDCSDCESKEILKEKQKQEHFLDEKKTSQRQKSIMQIVNTLFVCGTFTAAMVLIYKFA